MIKASGAQVLTRYPVASREAALVAMVPGILRTNHRNVVWPQSLPRGPCSASGSFPCSFCQSWREEGVVSEWGLWVEIL